MFKYKGLTDLREFAKSKEMKSVNKKSEEEIKEYLLECGIKIVKKEEDTKKEKVAIKTLKFLNNGWCHKLKKGYRIGTYQPKSQEEYEALKPFSEGE